MDKTSFEYAVSLSESHRYELQMASRADSRSESRAESRIDSRVHSSRAEIMSSLDESFVPYRSEAFAEDLFDHDTGLANDLY
jgi:hypothetical protein